jgi:DNA-binding Lrp family transcriptional regulator
MIQKNLDERDLKLMALLTDNARCSLAALARGIGLSRSATQERLQKLESSGAIERYTAIVGPPGIHWVDVWIRVKLGVGITCAKVAPAIVRMPAVHLCHALGGEIDLLVWIRAISAADASAAQEAIAALPGVAATETNLVLKSHTDRTAPKTS